MTQATVHTGRPWQPSLPTPEPCQDEPAKPVVTEENQAAAESSSPASPSQAAAAANIGSEPAPAYIRAELTSGGSTTNSMTHIPS